LVSTQACCVFGFPRFEYERISKPPSGMFVCASRHMASGTIVVISGCVWLWLPWPSYLIRVSASLVPPVPVSSDVRGMVVRFVVYSCTVLAIHDSGVRRARSASACRRTAGLSQQALDVRAVDSPGQARGAGHDA
jgi:hypothetical protein